jgi:carboxymethylenebutenolidase
MRDSRVSDRMSLLALALVASTAVSVPGTTAATFSRPEGKGPFPAVLLVEGWFQPGSWEKETAAALVDEGYAVLAVLPERTRPADRNALHQQMSAPPAADALAGLKAAREWLLARRDVDAQRLAVMGARMGGRDAMALAGEKGVKAVVSWYGAPPPAERAKALKTPVLAFFGGQDMGPTPADAKAFEEATRGRSVQVQVYPEAMHGFAEKGNPWGGYHEATALDAWQRALAFLKQQVGPARP